MEVRQPADRDMYQIAQGHGLKFDHGNGNDVEEVYIKAKEVVDWARANQKPVFLEFETYRWREHCGPHYDNNVGYRTDEEFLEWQARDPVLSYQTTLMSSGVIDHMQVEQWTAELADEVAVAIQFAKNSPFPDPATAGNNVYA